MPGTRNQDFTPLTQWPLFNRLLFALLAWLLAIVVAHHWINGNDKARRGFGRGYVPVVSNMTAPLPDYASRDGDGIRFKTLKLASYAELADISHISGIEGILPK